MFFPIVYMCALAQNKIHTIAAKQRGLATLGWAGEQSNETKYKPRENRRPTTTLRGAKCPITMATATRQTIKPVFYFQRLLSAPICQ